eukprot:PRCOL_00007232-RA
MPAPARAAPLPVGWTEGVDPRTGAPYYFNVARGVTQWERPRPPPPPPGGMAPPSGPAPVPARATAAAAPAGGGARPPAAFPQTVQVDTGSSVTTAAIQEEALARARAAVPPGKRARNPGAHKWMQERPSKSQRGGRGDGGGGGGDSKDEIDPMDPSSYSDAPRGGWGTGIERARGGKPRNDA